MTELPPDVMDALAGLAPGSALFALRRQRPEVVRHINGSDDALFAPADDGGLSRAERTAAALRIAIVLRDAALCTHYRGRLAPLDPDGGLAAKVAASAAGDHRLALILAHAERVITAPDAATGADLDGLAAAGLAPHAIVSLSQVIAYVNFQSRVLAGLRMLQGEAQ